VQTAALSLAIPNALTVLVILWGLENVFAIWGGLDPLVNWRIAQTVCMAVVSMALAAARVVGRDQTAMFASAPIRAVVTELASKDFVLAIRDILVTIAVFSPAPTLALEMVNVMEPHTSVFATAGSMELIVRSCNVPTTAPTTEFVMELLEPAHALIIGVVLTVDFTHAPTTVPTMASVMNQPVSVAAITGGREQIAASAFA